MRRSCGTTQGTSAFTTSTVPAVDAVSAATSGALAAAGIVDRPQRRAPAARSRAAGSSVTTSVRPVAVARGEHVAEHREASVDRDLVRRVEALLARLAAEGDDDLRHRARL